MQEILLQTTWQEWLGVAFSMIQVLLAHDNNPLNYLFGIIGVSLTLYVMQASGLYAECGLNVYYLVMSIFGWLNWLRKQQSSYLAISKSNRRDWSITAAIVLGSFTLSALILHYFTDSQVPVFDAAVSAFAWAGMWLMAKRKLENWILLNISNLLAIPLMVYKELYLYAFLSVFLFIVAVFGYRNWRRIMQKGHDTAGELI